MTLRQTPLIEAHKRYGGRLIDFSGWELPVQYEGVIKEHRIVREKAGLFDVSHMGEIIVKGEKAEDFVYQLLTNDIKSMQDFQVQYNLMCYPDGGVVDDLLVYKFDARNYLLVVNAANTDKDYAWIKQNAFSGVQVLNVSEQYAQLAVQGPCAQDILQKLTDYDLNNLQFFYFAPGVTLAGKEVLISRTGYTGEDGFELYVAPADAVFLWDKILDAGGEDICPVGLGARDTLRFEAKLPLYGQEIAADITPLEAGLGFFVKLDKSGFIGQEALIKQKENGLPRKLVELVMKERGIARSHYEVHKDGIKIGYVTSGAYAPSLDKNLGLALVDSRYASPGTEIEIIIRNKPVKAEIGKSLFYQKKTKSNK